MAPRWILLCMLGEGAGIAGVATAYAAGDRGLVAAAPAILAAGAWEGLCLGGAQAAWLKRTGVAASRWVLATVLVAVLGYAGSLGFGAGEAPSGPGAEPPLSLILLAGAGLGLVLGPLMGLAQALAAGGQVRLGAWALANLAGWVPAMAIIMAAAALAGATWPLAAVTLLGAGAGALAGGCIGVATSRALPHGPADV